MIKSHIEFVNGKPFISVDKKILSPMAYTTYFEECGEFSDFIKSGYRMFFINVSFTDLPINNRSGFTPFRTGVFETDEPDYSEFDRIVNDILAQCPDALIFPRIYISMPRHWVKSNPYETVVTPIGDRRESLFSDAFRQEGTKLLLTLADHIRSSEYADNIAGWQLSGGLTQEWMHMDFFGSFSDMGLKKFAEWLKVQYNITDAPVLTKDDLNSTKPNRFVSYYGEFCSQEVAKTIDHFAKAIKEHINNEQIVGVFYGYNAFVNDYLLGLHGLRFIIDSPYIDFFSSPCCYDGNRYLGIDRGDMVPCESVKAHGKLYFVECDIRTHLTRRMQDSRPGEYADNILLLKDENGNKTVWSGPDTPELSLSAIRKAFAHQLTKASGIWWFDMWGGWYHDDEIMAEIKKMKQIADDSEQKNPTKFPGAETVIFIDEKAYINYPLGSPLRDTVNRIRVPMGNTGIPFDLCMTEDAQSVIHKYKAAIFTAPIPTESCTKAVELCESLNIPFLSATREKPYFTEAELRSFLVSAGVHCYNPDGCVVYCGEGYLGIHSVADGKTKLTLPRKFRVKSLFGADFDECEADEIHLDMKKHDTAIFELFEIH